MDHAEEKRLFEQVKKGNLDAYEQLFRSKYTSLVNFAVNLISSNEHAEEIVQDVFVYIWEKRMSITINTSVSNYLFASVKNKCFNYLKLEQPKLYLQTNLEDVQLADQSTAEPDERLSQLLSKAINELPEKCKEIFVLSRYAGLTYKEIADELGISVKTVENQMSIALNKLREAIKIQDP